MRPLILAAAIANVIAAAPVVAGNWENVVSHVAVDSGVTVDYKNPAVSIRGNGVAAGRYGNQALQFTGTERFTLNGTPFALHSNFTIEGEYLFNEVTTSNQYLLDLGNNGFTLRYYRSGGVDGVCVHTSGSTLLLQTSFIPTPGVWFHVAIVRQGSLIKLFINGEMLAQNTYTASQAQSTVTLGNYGGGGSYSIRGLINQFRVTAQALYTENFTPEARMWEVGGAEANFDPHWGSVNLMIDRNSLDNMIDTKNGATVDKVGDAAISTTIKKIGLASMAFASSGSYFKIDDTGDKFDFGALEWCIECWVRPSQTTGGFTHLVGRGNPTSYSSWQLGLNAMRPTIRVSLNGKSWGSTVSSGTGAEQVQVGRWTHIAAARFGNSLLLFIDGKLMNTGTVTGSLVASTMPVTIGAGNDGSSQFYGNIGSVRITRGNSRYTNSFTPKMKNAFAITDVPTGPVVGDVYNGKVSGFLPMTPDLSAGGRQWQFITARASNALDNTRQLFGKPTLTLTTGAAGGFAYSNGTKTTMGAVDATAEGWINTDYAGTTVLLPIVGQYHASLAGAWALGVYDKKALFYIRGGASIAGTKNIADNQWHHVAISVRSGVAYLYVDGVLENSASVAAQYPTYNGHIHVGYNVAVEATAGYRCNLARVRITQGRGRYNAAFTADENTIPLTALAA